MRASTSSVLKHLKLRASKDIKKSKIKLQHY